MTLKCHYFADGKITDHFDMHQAEMQFKQVETVIGQMKFIYAKLTKILQILFR